MHLTHILEATLYDRHVDIYAYTLDDDEYTGKYLIKFADGNDDDFEITEIVNGLFVEKNGQTERSTIIGSYILNHQD